MLVAFTLTMPSCGSWNGRWSSEKDLHVKVINLTKTLCNKYKIDEKLGENFYYRWNDGWGANIYVEKVDSKKAAKLRKNSKGFCGYDWMIDSILDFGEILNNQERTKIK